MPSPMTRPNRHRIQRQIGELTIGASSEGPAVHQALAGPFWDRAAPELERVFDRVAGPDELLQVERLELDLGTMGGGEWVSEFRMRLVAELTRTLAQFTAVPESPEERRADRQPAEGWRQFLFFLAHGRLPWWSAAPAKSWTGLLPNVSEADWNRLREAVVSDPRARSRLVYSVDDGFLDRAIAVWSGVPEAARALAELTPNHLAADTRRNWRRGFWTVVLDWAATGKCRSPHGGPRLVSELTALRHTFDSHDGVPPRPFRPAPDEGGERADRSPTVEEFELPEPWRGWFESQTDAAPPERDTTEGRTATGERNRGATADSPPPAGASKSPLGEVEEEAIYLPGAGIVLVHPFLEQLFRERGLLEGRVFRDLEARHRAVHLIGFLTFGRLDVAEYELVLAKALCGAALEEPLEPVPLQDDDIASCELLLDAVLKHWTALRSSSAEWMREQFFLREGKLEDVDSGWLLTIERHAQDVLLARLPWGLGVVAPPWLSERIFVHWLE